MSWHITEKRTFSELERPDQITIAQGIINTRQVQNTWDGDAFDSPRNEVIHAYADAFEDTEDGYGGTFIRGSVQFNPKTLTGQMRFHFKDVPLVSLAHALDETPSMIYRVARDMGIVVTSCEIVPGQQHIPIKFTNIPDREVMLAHLHTCYISDLIEIHKMYMVTGWGGLTTQGLVEKVADVIQAHAFTIMRKDIWTWHRNKEKHLGLRLRRSYAKHHSTYDVIEKLSQDTETLYVVPGSEKRIVGGLNMVTTEAPDAAPEKEK